MFSVTFIFLSLKDNHYANYAVHQNNQDQLLKNNLLDNRYNNYL